MDQHTHEFSTEKEIVELAIGYVFRELGLKHLASAYQISTRIVRKHLVEFGVRIRNTHEQRRCDIRRGRYSQAETIRAAWQRGAYDTEAFQNTRHKWNAYERYGERNPFFGKKHSKQTRNKLASYARDRVISGVGEYGAEWTSELRARVLRRDNYTCQVCGATECMLQIHHVDHDRTNSGESNLLTLCAACHLAYHGRQELMNEVREAHLRLLARSEPQREVPPC